MGYSKKQIAKQVVGATEAAELLGISPGTVTSYVARGQIVAPLARLSCGPVWLRDDLERWQAKRKGTA